MNLGGRGMNPLPDDKMLDWSKLRAIADNNQIGLWCRRKQWEMKKMLIVCLDFLCFPQRFQMLLLISSDSSYSLEVMIQTKIQSEN